MKVLHLSRPDSEASGIAAYTLHYNLLKKGVESFLFVKNEKKKTKDSTIIRLYEPIVWGMLSFFRKIVNKLLQRRSDDLVNKYHFQSLNEREYYTSTRNFIKKIPFKPDIIVIYFTDNFLTTRNIKELYNFYKVPIYWYLVDMSSFTGGCHFSWDCTRYIENCFPCPGISSDLPSKNLDFKRSNLKHVDLKIIVGSEWLYKKAKKSKLFYDKEFKEIMLPVDFKIYNSSQRRTARSRFLLPSDKYIIFFGTQSFLDERKGMKYLLEAFKILFEKLDEAQKRHIILLSAGKHSDEIEKSLDVNIKSLGLLSKEDLSLAYQSSDLFVCPSVQDTGPYMLIESIACGTPVVSFNMGLALNFVKNNYSGYRAELYKSEELAQGILKMFSQSKETNYVFRKNCINLANEFLSVDTQVDKIMELFNNDL